MGLKGKILKGVFGSGKHARAEYNNERKVDQMLKRADMDKAKTALIRHEKHRKLKLNESRTRLAELHTTGTSPTAEIKLFYTFTAPTLACAEALQKELEGTYETNPIQEDDGVFSITGLSTPKKMDRATVDDWVFNMCNVAYKVTCEFDNWSVKS